MKGKVSVIQIAYDDILLVVHLNPAWITLPRFLEQYLTSPIVLKLGRQVGGDFNQIKESFNIVCQGNFELGKFCRSKKVIRSGKSSLSDICKEVLGTGLSKNLRISDWSYSSELTSSQIQHAALDAWVSLEIYKRLKEVDTVGREIVGTPKIGQYISIATPLGPAAYGTIKSFSNVNGSVTDDNDMYVEISIILVVIPSFVIPSYNDQSETVLESIVDNPDQTVYVKKITFTY